MESGPKQSVAIRPECETGNVPDSDTLSPSHLATLSPDRTASSIRAFFYLVWLSVQRQARARQMVLIALGLLIFTFTLVALNTAGGRWTMHRWRAVRGGPNFQEAVNQMQAGAAVASAAAPLGTGITEAVLTAAQQTMDDSAFAVF